jgi:hypothetical protein
MRFTLLALAMHLFQNTLAGELSCAAALTKPDPCVLSEHDPFPTLRPTYCVSQNAIRFKP